VIFFPINLCLALKANYALASLRDLQLFGVETYGPLQLYHSISYTFFRFENFIKGKWKFLSLSKSIRNERTISTPSIKASHVRGAADCNITGSQ
jgi:hypothetical protein